jgi:RNA polymerase-binding protein DksA
VTSAPITPAVAKPAAAKLAKRTPAVREDESPWTTSELAEVRTELEIEIGRLGQQISDAEDGIADLLRDSGDGAGDDQADAGTKTFEREHEMSLANNARELLVQNERALARLHDGTYGVCERCGKPIGKLRLQAFPRATLCVSCKQLEERR